jgi:hypothetical protein
VGEMAGRPEGARRNANSTDPFHHQNPFTATGNTFMLEQYNSKASRRIPC